MPKSPARIAVLGAGLIGQRHVELVADHATLSAVVDPSPASRDIAARHGALHFSSLDDLLADHTENNTLDGVIVATPNLMHEENGLQLVDARLPMLMEKPLTDTTASAERLVTASEKEGVPILVGHHRRHNPIVQTAREAVTSGHIGNPVSAHTTCWFYKPDDYFNMEWRRKSGAGPVFINLIHDVDLLIHYFGPLESVQAMESSATRGFEVEDTAVILLRFQNGALGTITVSDTVASPWSWELCSGENPAYPMKNQSSTVLGGTKGSLSVPDLTLWQHKGDASWWNPINNHKLTVEQQDPLVLQTLHFADICLGKAKPLVTATDGMTALKAIVAIKEAANTGKTVRLD